MSRSPLVTVIIIFFNGELYFEEAVESVFAQNYDQWELLLVDDGSTDNSTAIAQKYTHKYPEKVRYLDHDGHRNRGMSATRNLGITQAKGEFVAFLDADDVWLPQKLERQVALLEQYLYVGMVAGPTQYWYSWTRKPADQNRDCLREIGVQPNLIYEPPFLLSRLLRNEANAPATCGVLIRRSIFETVGFFEESFRGLFEDRAFFSKVYLKHSVFVMDTHLDRYRQHPDSTCHLEKEKGRYSPYKRNEAHLSFLQWLERYLMQEAVQDQEVWQALKASFLPYKNLPLHYVYQLSKRVMRFY
ncbi:glycosyltransferase family 2 protein [Leptolyngbya sp. FACHB-60]|nr:glycosyltransferase family 2 protein [Phormidium sp. FACHB-77]MBD2030207.1 glycosyltransferase family 2 protein [Phormidium sp. FACHB-322]